MTTVWLLLRQQQAIGGRSPGSTQGGVAEQRLDAYVDEFVFRFNRRTSRKRGLLFYRLLELAVWARPTTYATIVWSRRGQASTVRGRARSRLR